MDFRKIEFRLANDNDIEDIMRIETSSFDLEICEKSEVFLERINVFHKGFFIMEYGNETIGYLSSELWEYKDDIAEKDFKLGHSIKESHRNNGTELYISSMGVSPKYRGKQLGKLMFEEFSKYIVTTNNNLKSIILIVSEKWKRARKIYKDNSFQEILRIESFFEYNKQSDYNEDGIVMRKYL
ncbi:GNAT family N-acetyltransferase [Wukongibacter baidiensis]|uniref:GNAT family N-acetyltransferase n=1 Tax=Wukongibacter baidiensis TaxID=1723361 RepID=UPI003D7FCFEA